jgi:hypothetical protein
MANKPAAMRIDLSCGNYHFTQVDISNALTSGRTTIGRR